MTKASVPGPADPSGGSQSDTADWRQIIHELAAFERPSASEGERRAAELIAERLRALGCRSVAVEAERAHGGYWWPLGLANGVAAAGAAGALRAGTRGARTLAAALSGFAAAAIWDDTSGGSLWFRRRLLPHRSTWNVIAEAGDPHGSHTVVMIAHHDAAHSGLVFHPALGRIGPRLAPRSHARATQTFPIMYLVWGGSVLVLAGALTGFRRLMAAGVALATGTAAAMADIGARRTVPGANDNLSAVGVLLAVARRLHDRPVEGLRVLLLSTGSEESFMEGMQGFARRHFAELDPERTEMVCLECLGGPDLIVLEGEGMLRMRHYPAQIRDDLARAAKTAGVRITRGLKTVAATDGLIALRAGYRVGTLASIDETKLPLNYHWPTDTPDALHWQTIEDAIDVCETFLRQRSAG